MKTALQPILDKICRYCNQTGVNGRTVTLKIRFADFHQITRSRALTGLVESRSGLEEIAIGLLESVFPIGKPVRLLRVALSTLNTEEKPQSPQLSLSL